MEWMIEFIDHLMPFHFTFRDYIKLFFDICCETVIHDIIKIFGQKVYHQHTHICGEKMVF